MHSYLVVHICGYDNAACVKHLERFTLTNKNLLSHLRNW